MAAPFFDPRQYLTSGPIAPTSPLTPSFNPQGDILDQIRKQQEEEEEKRLNAEKMLADLIERSRNKEEERRIERLRSEMPQEVYDRLHKGYYGDPQSKAGKVGSAILQIGSGMFGTAPDINKAAMEQWKTQQAAANAADTIQQREQAAAAGAISRMQQSQSRMAETESKNKTTIAGKLIEAQVREAKNAIDRLKVLGQQKGIDAKAALDAANTDLIKKWGAIKTMGGIKDDGLLLTIYEKEFGKEAADQLAKNMTGATLLEKYQPATPGSTSVTQSPLVNPQTGEFMGMKPPSTSVRSGRPQIGDPNALLRARGLTTNDAVNPQAPQMPQMQPQPAAMPMAQPQPAAPRQAIPAAPQAAQPPQGAPAVPTTASETDWGKSIGRPYYRLDSFIPSKGGSEAIKVAAVPRGNFIGNVKPPALTAPEKAAQEATNTFITNTASMNQMLQDAYASGKLQKQFGTLRSLAGMVGADKAFSEIYKRAGDPESKSLELAFQALNTRTIADFLKKQSGAQVSEREYGRLAQAYESGALDARGNLELSYINSVTLPAMINLEKLGALNEGTASTIGRQIEMVSKERMREYTTILDKMASNSNDSSKTWQATKKAYEQKLKDLTSPEETLKEVLRRAFPDSVGSTLVLPDNAKNRDIYIYLPYGNKDMEEINRKRRRAMAKEAVSR